MSVVMETELVYRGLTLTAEEVADALWLAAYVTVAAAPAPAEPKADAASPESVESVEPPSQRGEADIAATGDDDTP